MSGIAVAGLLVGGGMLVALAVACYNIYSSIPEIGKWDDTNDIF